MAKILLLELNEFNLDLLTNESQRLGLQNIQKMLHMHASDTFTDDTYESDFLEPWVQWTSIHTGQPSCEHHIKHLGDVPPHQLWQKLSEKGVSSGIWLAMNAGRSGATNCRFFLPDPWTASERAFPEELNELLEPVRYISKNYTHRSFQTILPLLWRLVKYLRAHRLVHTLFSLLPDCIRYKGKPFVFIAFTDYLSTLLFLQYKKQHNPDFSLLFVNTLAHIQHHHWHKESKPLEHGLRMLDKILGRLFQSLQPDELFLVTNALSQKNTEDEKAWILYRQIDPKEFLDAVGIIVDNVEAHMTHDAHLFFSEPKACLEAKKILDDARICGQKLFLTEAYPDEPKKLFYRVVFTDPVTADTQFSLQGKSFRFLDLFVPIIQRTGKHTPFGKLFSTQKYFPPSMKNHELFHHIMQLFDSAPKEPVRSLQN